ncbi:MAG: glycosyltransferase family 4 protein [Chloroflexi bacterium]|nr:glycosyltransferase family 4 protein [Chloroflexota bacterium]MBP7044947.1 glycosyltransferase family 4 protein [Chloroflexota bacterium]
MKVLLLRPQIEAGGASRVIIQLVSGLKASGVEVEVATAGGEWLPKLEEIVTCHKISLYPSTPQNLLRSILELHKLVSIEKYQLLNPHHRFASIACNLLPVRKLIPIVSTVHETKTDRTIFSSLTFAPKAIVFSQAVKENLIRYHHFIDHDIFLVPMGVDVLPPDHKELAVVKKEFLLSEDAPTVSCITRLSQEKGCETFLRAVALVLSRGIRVKFLLVGDGPQKNELSVLAERLNLKGFLEFTGWRNDVPAIIENSNFLVLPSISEGVGIAIIEGMALKKPTIGTLTGGIPEVIKDLETGLLVPPGDPEALANAIISLIEDQAFCRQLGLAGQKHYEERFSLKNMIERTLETYTTLSIQGSENKSRSFIGRGK